jgi:hypothetical protein
MSRLEWLQMKRTCASYGPPLTPDEQIELFRLEAMHSGGARRRIGRVEEVTELHSFAQPLPALAR